ncbi:hypothetical protein M9H77_36519 [Catharanthus roseus]|uniref:Uncharacterized protein n=1 Tax=Catharanthus roseus TaxID=4058 RepID=A0ACB9ZT24_CATRO|nr:hypothetical protein M9H77_36519 [Catharanthus roseus]
MGKSWKRATLPPTVDPALPSPVGFYQHNSEGMTPTADDRFHPNVTGRFLRHIFQHRRCIPSCAMNAISLERIGTTIFMPSKGCEGLKKRRGS